MHKYISTGSSLLSYNDIIKTGIVTYVDKS